MNSKPKFEYVTELVTITRNLDGESTTKKRQWTCRKRKVLRTMEKTRFAPAYALADLKDHGSAAWNGADGDRITAQLREFLSSCPD